MAIQNLIIPLYLSAQSYSLQQIGIGTGAFFFGLMLGELPSGILLNYTTPRRAMLAGALVLSISSFALYWAISFPVFIALRLIAGFSLSVYGLARHSYATNATKNESRGSVLTWLGGTHRLGKVLGPLIGGWLAARFGLNAGFGLMGTSVLLGFISILLFMPAQTLDSPKASGSALVELWTVLQDNIGIISIAGLGQFFMQLVRATPRTVIPLVGDSLGMPVDVIGLVETIGGAFDTAFFWTSGHIMDRFGRKWAIVPSILTQVFGIVLIPFAGGFVGLTIANSIIGLGNTISSGAMLTLGADLSPEKGRSEFLSLLRLSSDLSFALTPTFIGVIGSAFVLSTSAFVAGALGVVGAAIFIWGIPETLQKK